MVTAIKRRTAAGRWAGVAVILILLVGAAIAYAALSSTANHSSRSSQLSSSTHSSSSTGIAHYSGNESFRFVQAIPQLFDGKVAVNATFLSNLPNPDSVRVVTDAYLAYVENPYGENQTFCCPLITSASNIKETNTSIVVDAVPHTEFSSMLVFPSLKYSTYLVKLYITSSGGELMSPVSSIFLQKSNGGVAGGEAGASPMFYDDTNGLLYVANPGLDSVTVINGSSERVFTTISLPDLIGSPMIFYLYDPGNLELYVGAQDSPEIFAINTATNFIEHKLVTSASDQSISSMVYDPTNGRIFCVDFVYSRLLVIDDSTDRILTNITLASSPGGAVYDGKNNEILVSVYNGTNFAINADTLQIVGRVSTTAYPFFYDPDNGIVYASQYNQTLGGRIIALNGTTLQPVGSEISSSGGFLFYDPSNRDMYFYSGQGSNYVGGNLTAISTNTNEMVANIPVPGLDEGLVAEEPTILLDPNNGNIYATELTNPQTASVGFLVINSESNEVVSQTSPHGIPLDDLAIDSSNGLLYGGFEESTYLNGDSIYVLNLQTGIISSIELGTVQTYGLLP